MRISVFTFCLYVIGVFAGALRKRSLSRAKGLQFPASVLQEDAARRNQEIQNTLILDADEIYQDADRHSTTLEIESGSWYGFPFYYTNIALGTPNQAFRVLLDLDYGGLIIRAPGCNAPYFDCGPGFEYNHSASSTYQDEHERFGLHLPGQFAYGNVSTDYMQLVSLNISNVTFGEVDDFSGENLFLIMLEYVVDGYE